MQTFNISYSLKIVAINHEFVNSPETAKASQLSMFKVTLYWRQADKNHDKIDESTYNLTEDIITSSAKQDTPAPPP